MKLFEMLKFIKFKPRSDSLKMLDLCSAPGMFILSAETYLKKYHKKTALNWYACSIADGLKDSFGLFANNPARFVECDIINEREKIKERFSEKFELITADGATSRGDWFKLQEDEQTEIFNAEILTALDMLENNGIFIIKFYSLVRPKSHLLISETFRHFKKLILVKPYTSRICNAECYLIFCGFLGDNIKENLDLSAELLEFDKRRLDRRDFLLNNPNYRAYKNNVLKLCEIFERL